MIDDRHHMVDAFAYALKSWPPKPIDIFQDYWPWKIYRRWKRKAALEKMSLAIMPSLSTPNRKWFRYDPNT